MKITTRIIADVDPKIKERLKSLSDQKNESMTEVITKMINQEYEWHFGIQKTELKGENK